MKAVKGFQAFPEFQKFTRHCGIDENTWTLSMTEVGPLANLLFDIKVSYWTSISHL